ncbi:MmgE/PrpD family protein [Mesorhizobium sp. YIM 152430]|uniref:MmgE/PrpD family protein n=1 Tax=Mesorhizobium sp. YIM 152430 TaxID=3031761 RepID=UPI0023DC5374|nr:MmgE/PrpD family protein [Mesorhizobium sp. YIM 152430]MDF1600710.1 MmgE/PrpD family protein [Mesorhizobium sp. YIM 152430]
MTLTRDLVRLIRTKPVADADLERAAGFVVDTLACALAARDTAPAKAIATLSSWSTPDSGRRAFYFGGLAHILELDDLHRTSVTHPGTVVVPAAAALAETLQASGRDFLISVLHGYEACCRVGNAVGKAHYRVWHNTATCGTFGAAMAAAHLLDLSEDQAVWALGNAGTQSGGVWEFLSAGAMSKHLHTARAAESGVIAALLAREGFTGADTILEGEKGFFAALCPDPLPHAVLADADGPWELVQTSIKPWPCCRHTHPAIDAALGLNSRLDGATPDEIRVETYRAALDVCDRPDPTEPYGAKFSLQHCVAEAIRAGAVTTSSFDGDHRAAARDLRAITSLGVDPAIEAAYPRAWGASVKARVGDIWLEERRAACKGDPENPLDREELTVKAIELLGLADFDSGAARGLIDEIYALADRKAPVATFQSVFLRA